jgi:hypothetical protein
VFRINQQTEKAKRRKKITYSFELSARGLNFEARLAIAGSAKEEIKSLKSILNIGITAERNNKREIVFGKLV